MDERRTYDRIVLCGASSAGKTTVGEDWCKKHPEFHLLQEVARELMCDRGITGEDLRASHDSDDKRFFLDFERHVFEEQNARESSLPPGRPVIIDRGPDPLAFVQFHVGQNEAEELALRPEARLCLQRYRQPNYLIVVVSPLDQPTEDGLRNVLSRKDQIIFTRILRQILNQQEVPHVTMEMTDRQERIQFLEQLVNGEVQSKGKFDVQDNILM